MRTSGILWRDTARNIRVGFLDAYALTGFVLWILHMCMETFILSIVIIVFFASLERFGVTPQVSWRYIRQSCFSEERCPCSFYSERTEARW